MKKYSVTHFDMKARGSFALGDKQFQGPIEIERVQIAWQPDEQTSHALLFENPNHINLIPLILEEAGYELSEDSVF
jgi:hypothetical protein